MPYPDDDSDVMYVAICIPLNKIFWYSGNCYRAHDAKQKVDLFGIVYIMLVKIWLKNKSVGFIGTLFADMRTLLGVNIEVTGRETSIWRFEPTYEGIDVNGAYFVQLTILRVSRTASYWIPSLLSIFNFNYKKKGFTW